MIATVIGIAPARAQVADHAEAEKEALRLNRRSRALYDQGRYAEAAELLRKAHRMKAVPILQYNLARACEGLHDYACAIAAYESYLPHAPREERSKVEELLVRYRKRLANWRAPAAPVLQHAQPVLQASPPVQPAPPVVPQALPQALPPAVDTREPPSRSVLPPITAAAGGVAFGVGLYLTARARDENEDALRAQTPLSEARNKRDRAESLIIAGNAAMIGGGIVAAVGVTWWILDRRASHRPLAAARLSIGPGTIAISAPF
jgi:tetratricopeptide (TPR) repeat protein